MLATADPAPARRLLLSGAALLLALWGCQGASAQQKRIYIACDDHTDYFWTTGPATYRKAFVETLDYYLARIEAAAGRPHELQPRFACDGWLWMWEYERSKPKADFERLIARIKDGHISVPLNALSLSQGGAPAEAVLRGMYYPGRVQRRHGGVPFELAYSIENPVYPFGIVSLWAGSGAKYTWNGSYYGDTRIAPDARKRPHEMYWWVGRDGRRLLTKWYNHVSGDGLGGYAEARNPGRAVEALDRKAGSRAHPYLVVAAFGKGHDDVKTLTDEFERVARQKSNASRKVIVSNETDFFKDFEATYGSKLPSLSVSFGNDWDLYPATIAEVSARLRRAVEKLRAAEAMATLVGLTSPAFLDGRQEARDQAFAALGLYWEHDINMIGQQPGRRLAWQRDLEARVTRYVGALHADAAAALGGLIAREGQRERFFVFNPLGWTRTDVADYPHAGAAPVHVLDLATGQEAASQIVRLESGPHLRILAAELPSVGYKVYEIRKGAGRALPGGPVAKGGVLENGLLRVAVAERGAITSLVDKAPGGRELVRAIDGRAMNDLGPSEGALEIENAGPVSVTLRATAPSPLKHTTRITLHRSLPRVDIRNEITQNFDCDFSRPFAWAYSVNADKPNVWHEECGAVIRARLAGDGGHYSPVCSRLDWLTLNHFADLSASDGRGITLSNADCYFFKLGKSAPASLDTATPQINVLVGGRVGGSKSSGFRNQGGDARFLQRFALRPHRGYREAAAIRFAFEHQNPPVPGMVRGGSAYPPTSFSLVSVSSANVVLWALKPAEEGIGRGVIVRLWNHSDSSTAKTMLNFSGGLASARTTTHIETDLGEATVTDGALAVGQRGNWMQTYRLLPKKR